MDTSSTNDDSYLFDARAVEELGRFLKEARLHFPLSGDFHLCLSIPQGGEGGVEMPNILTMMMKVDK